MDVFSGDVLAPYLDQTETPLSSIEAWRQSSSKWKRRASAVTCVYLIGKRPVKELLNFIEPLLNDPDKPVQQGAGWLLKDTWKHYPNEVEAFLLPRVGDAGTITLQIAREKMPKEKKELFKRKAKKS